MVETEFIEDAYDYEADFVAAIGASGDRLDEHVQRLFAGTRVERRKSPAEIRRAAPFEPNPGR